MAQHGDPSEFMSLVHFQRASCNQHPQPLFQGPPAMPTLLRISQFWCSCQPAYATTDATFNAIESASV